MFSDPKLEVFLINEIKKPDDKNITRLFLGAEIVAPTFVRVTF